MTVNINFENTYLPLTMSDDFSTMTFEPPQKNGADQLLLVKIDNKDDPLLPNVYNLGFGPPNGTGSFTDNVRLKHTNVHKVFSTILFQGLSFLGLHPKLTLGIDGSDDLRAALYHGMFRTNKKYLSPIFNSIGVDWYVRIFRNGQYEQDNEGYYIAKPRPEPFDYKRTRHDLYRYYMFKLNQSNVISN